jgi:PAS domain S-box-containing protein
MVDYAIYLIDPRGRIATWNPGARRLKGYEAEEAIGQHYSLLFTEEDRRFGGPEAEGAAAPCGHAEAARVLVVDGETAVARLATGMLEGAGHWA